MQLKGPVEALKMALNNNKLTGKELIHHSDRGLQQTRCRAIVRSDCSNEYISLLKNKQVAISMTRNGDPGENAVAERINGTIKNEFRTRC